MRIIGVNPEVADPIEDKIQDIPLEVKIFTVEVKEIRIHTKVNIKMTAIKATITRVIEDSIIPHAEIFLKVIVMVNQEEEAMAMAEAITKVMVTVGPIINNNNNNVYFRIYTCKLNYNRQMSVRLT